MSSLTAWVKDSGDDWSPSTSHGSDAESDGDATDLIYEGEYDIASSDSDNTNARIDSGSDTDDVKVSISMEYTSFMLIVNSKSNNRIS